MVKNLPAMQETQIQFLGQEDLLEKEMATHFSILAWRIPWTEQTDGLSSCSRDDRPPLELYVEPAVLGDDAQGCQCPFVLCLHPQGH